MAPGADEEDGLRARRDATRQVQYIYSVSAMLEGKRIFITGGAGFIGTTLARELVDRNTIVAFDNLHRDALSGHDLADHPNFELIQGDILDADALSGRARRARRTSSTARRSPASTPCSRARCGRCAST